MTYTHPHDATAIPLVRQDHPQAAPDGPPAVRAPADTPPARSDSPGGAPGAPAAPPSSQLVQMAVLIAETERRPLAPDEAEVLRRGLGTVQAAEAARASAEGGLFEALAELGALRVRVVRADRWRAALAGPSPLTPKRGATQASARLLASRWDAHWPGGAR